MVDMIATVRDDGRGHCWLQPPIVPEPHWLRPSLSASGFRPRTPYWRREIRLPRTKGGILQRTGLVLSFQSPWVTAEP